MVSRAGNDEFLKLDKKISSKCFHHEKGNEVWEEVRVLTELGHTERVCPSRELCVRRTCPILFGVHEFS
jgi:hypothetical protein